MLRIYFPTWKVIFCAPFICLENLASLKFEINFAVGKLSLIFFFFQKQFWNPHIPYNENINGRNQISKFWIFTPLLATDNLYLQTSFQSETGLNKSLLCPGTPVRRSNYALTKWTPHLLQHTSTHIYLSFLWCTEKKKVMTTPTF